MIRLRIIRLTILLIMASPYAGAQERSSLLLDNGWKFTNEDVTGSHRPDFDDSSWKEVTVPHDWAIRGPFIEDGDGNTGKLPWKGVGWYRRSFSVPDVMPENRIYLVCDGIMAFPEIYINGEFAGRWDYGYNSFFLDITKLVKKSGNNTIAVKADTRKHESRWYPGAGIYRKMEIIVTAPVHTAIWGVHVSTPVIKPHYADIRIATSVINGSGEDETVKVRQLIKEGDKTIVSGESEAELAEGIRKDIELTLTLTDPIRWDTEDPHLYTLVTEIYRAGKLCDIVTTRFGVREIRFTPNDGFWLNNRRVMLRGVNLHHDLGPLGAAFNRSAMKRQLEIMKSMGCNAIRTSHNTPAPELADMCDSMGLLLFSEVFDKWDARAGITDSTDFENFASRNIRNFIMRDRNHPSIFIWSVGNEIPDAQWNIDNGFSRLQTMVNYVRKFDTSRPVTLVCDSYESARLRHFDYYDVHAWNYGRRYSLARQIEPEKPVIISESASTLSTRGFYELPLPKDKTDFTLSLQVSSYDLNAPEWAELADDDFMWQQEEAYIAGEFVWTGFDYLGEPTPYNNQWVKENGMSDREASRSSYFGIVDLTGIPKDRYWLYKSYWNSSEETVHILPHWNWEGHKGENVPIFVYTSGDCAELFVNGQSQGMKCKVPKSDNSVERFRLMWDDVVYSPGELRAVAYKRGEPTGETVVKTAGSPYALRLTPEKYSIKGDGDDLSYILVESVDREGNLAPLAMNMVNIKVTGAASLVAVGNGNPQSFHSFGSDNIPLFYGKAMIITGKTRRQGKTIVEVTSDSLKGDSTTIIVQ
ncbi:MAG: glycoside hydrolase family 2 TIM barrel-domain containing protein [Bacteroidales bacterium]